MSTNLNDLARLVTHDEGLKIQLPIGQIKEVMGVVFRHLAAMDSEKVVKILRRYRPPGRNARPSE